MVVADIELALNLWAETLLNVVTFKNPKKLTAE